ncbi:uncharacterized protein BX663DRAFT_247279 [Cokeromyces recurvatus]|uniref:uncharacterized protein n=1 Tax=Cokeromyces recurvatus TaxID=90255 RepID=UPI0022202E34|nr:uncharacterized protein BX663DRAFT_247279 [Cokeromyces recurvatus]KAI7905972.1 hypothetical protein BX663DRAFT_247279 [Cokeromyces recurvatus]
MIHDDYGIEVIGLTMEKYDMTLRQYISKNSKPRLTVFQRMDIIIQMLKSIRSAHGMGIAHRDLSTVNFMVNTQSEENKFLPDGSIGVELFLIDFGKAIFFFQDDAEKWWVNTNEQNIYKDEMKPKTKEELVIWCKNLPYIMARPDHGYRFYRSIQTLPRTQKDHRILPYLIHPAAEDIYSLGTLVWKIFSGMEPWPGVFDTDLKKLRETVCEDYIIDNLLEREMPGPISKKFLQKFLRVRPEDRRSAAEILTWLEQPDVNIALLDEWNMQENRSLTKSRIESVIYLRSPTSTVSTATIPAAELSSRENHKSMTSSSKMPTAPSSRKRAGIEWEKEADVPIVKRRKTRGRSKRCKTSQQVDDKPQPKKRGRPKGSRNKIQHVRFSPNRKYSKRHIQDELLKSINLDNHENISNEETKDVIEERTINLDNDFANNDSANDTVTFSEKEKETIQETSIDLETNIIHSDDHEHKVIKSNEISKTIEANLETSKEIEVISNINMADQTLLNSIDPDRTVTEGFTETMDKQDITSEISPSSPKPSTYINHKSASLSEQKTADLLVETTLPDSHKSAKITVDEGLSKITEKSLENQCIDSELNTPVPELIAPVNTNQTATEKEQASLNDQDNNIPKKKRRLNKLKDKVDELSNKIETICTESDKTNNGAVKKARKARKSNTLAKSTISSDTSKNIRNLDGPTIIRIPNFNLLASRNTEIQIQDINDQYTAHQTQDINDQATAHQSQKTIIQLGDTVDTSSDSQVAQSDDNSMNTTILPDKSIVENEDTVVHSQNTEMTKYQSVQTQGTIDQTLYYNTFNTDRPKPKRGRPRKNPVK